MAEKGSVNKDDRFYKGVISRSHKRFLEDLDPITLLDEFIEAEYLTSVQIRDIQDMQKQSDKIREILKQVRSKGVQGYKKFKQMLKKSGQKHLAEYLAELEDDLEKEISYQSIFESVNHGRTVQAQARTQTEHQRIPGDRELLSIAEHIGCNWEILGAFLGIRETRIDHIKLDYPLTPMRIFQMLIEWRNINGDEATVENLYSKMQSAPSCVNIDWEALKVDKTGKSKTWKVNLGKSFKKKFRFSPSSSDRITRVPESLGMFGVVLEECTPSPNNEFVPFVVDLCTQIVEARGLEVKGVYRVSCSIQALTALQEELNKGIESINLDHEKWSNVHVITSLLKSFFRQLPEPLIPDELYQPLMDANRIEDSQRRSLKLKRLIHGLPKHNFETFKHLAKHLNKVALYGDINRMEAKYLAMVFGPNLSNKAVTMITDISDYCKIIESLIPHYEWFFGSWENDNYVPTDKDSFVSDSKKDDPDSSVPDELASDPRTLELYEAAIREGKERDRNIRVMVVGCYGQGKSSLVRRLTRQSLEGVESTNGIEVQICESILDTQELWTIKHTGDVCAESMKRLATVAIQHQPLENTEHSSPVSSGNSDTLVAQKASSVIRPEQNQPNTDPISSPVSSGNSDTTRNDNLAQQSDEKEFKNVSGTVPTMDSLEFSKEIKKIEEEENILQEKTLEINIWDFGGQFVYYATHQLFHSRQAIYILVFDIAKGLGVKVYDEECPYEDMEKSMEEYLKFWIGSVHSFVGNEEGTEPPIFLVGTHLDMLDEHIDQDRRFEDVRQLFDDDLCASHIQPEQFAVSCTNPNHATFADIRRAVTAYALKKSAGLFIPAKWIPLERSLKENRHLKIITFEKVKEFDRSNDIPIASEDQLKLFLQYHHEKGTFFYFENENDAINHVVLDPQFLIDAFRCIITADKFCCVHQNLRKLWQKLHNEAVLEKELLDELWKKESDKEFMKFKKPLLFFLQKHRIIAEALAFDEASSTSVPLNFYIVPSLLKNTSEGMIDAFLKGKRYTKVSIGYNFEYVSTLCTVYNRVVAAALGRWPILKFRSTCLVYENAVVCKMNLSHSGILKRLKNSLELLVVSLCPEDVSTKVCDAFRRFVQMIIQDELHKFQTKDTEKQGHGYREVVRCYDKDHGYNGSRDFYEIDTLQTQNKDIIGCPDHENHYFSIKDIMTEWFNADIDADIPKRTLTEKELSKLSTSIGKNWEHLARMLGFSDAVIDQVSIDKITTPARIYEILKRWSAEQLDCATLDVLISAIRQCGQSLTVNKDTLKNLIDGTSLSRQY